MSALLKALEESRVLREQLDGAETRERRRPIVRRVAA